MAFASFFAYKYTIFSPVSIAMQQDNVIDLDEGLALVTLLCVGLLVLSWRLLLSQRREVTRRTVAERHARELAHQDSLTGLPNR